MSHVAAMTNKAIHASQDIDVLLVDDCALSRAGLQRILEDASGVKLCGVADSLAEGVQLARACSPQVVLLDMHPPYLSFLKGPPLFQRQCPGIRVLALVSEAELLIPRCFSRAMLSGYVTKHCDMAELSHAIREVGRGARYISTDLAQCLATRELPSGPAAEIAKLSTRELQIMLLVTQGKGAREIAAGLNVTAKTVNGYRHRLLVKLGLQTEVELMRLAVELGIIGIHPGQLNASPS